MTTDSAAKVAITDFTTSDAEQRKHIATVEIGTLECWEQLACDVGVIASLRWKQRCLGQAAKTLRRAHSHSVLYGPAPVVAQPWLLCCQNRICSSRGRDDSALGCGHCRCQAHYERARHLVATN